MSASGSRRLSLRIFARTEAAPVENPSAQPPEQRSLPRGTLPEPRSAGVPPVLESSKLPRNFRNSRVILISKLKQSSPTFRVESVPAHPMRGAKHD